MTITVKYIKQIGKDLTGLRIKSSNKETTALLNLRTGPYINFSKEQLDNIPNEIYLRRGVVLKYKYVFVILHEVAHYRIFRRFKNSDEYYTWGIDRKRYKETLCDRYARRYAPRFIKKRRIKNEC